MPEWLTLISAVVGLMAGLVTLYEFFKVGRSSKYHLPDSGDVENIAARAAFKKILSYARFEFVMLGIAAVLGLIVGGGLALAADPNLSADTKGERLLLFFGSYFVIAIIIWVLLINPVYKRLILSVRELLARNMYLSEGISAIEMESAKHNYSINNIRKIVRRVTKKIAK